MSVAAVTCENCGTEFEVETSYFQVFGRDPYCRDCLVHTRCRSCDRGLRLEPSDHEAVGGDPVWCTDCGHPAQSQSPGTGLLAGTFWEGLTLGEKVVFPVLAILLLAILGYLTQAGIQGQEADAGIIPVGLLILLGWTYRRGKRNRSGS